MASYGFHSEAAEEYLAATQYYLDHGARLRFHLRNNALQSASWLLARAPYMILSLGSARLTKSPLPAQLRSAILTFYGQLSRSRKTRALLISV
jgi:hypothetical protein